MADTPPLAPSAAHAAIDATPPDRGPSDWVVRWSALLSPRSSVLDLACGSGRHVRWLAQRGHRVTAVDRDATAIAPLGALARVLVADLEADAWPLAGERFDAVVVTNYLWRPLLPALLAAVAPGGLLVYETFSEDQAALGRPRRPEFLLRHGELLELVRPPESWRVIAFEDGRLPADGDRPERAVQRIAARRSPFPDGARQFLVAAG